MKRTSFLLLLAGACSLGCETSDPSQAVIQNRYTLRTAGITVYKGWWAVAAFSTPIPPEQDSDPVRVVKGADYAYALLAPGWEPSGGTPPTQLIPVRTTAELKADRGDTLQIVLSDETTIGNCGSSQPLDQMTADFITQRIFPGEFSGRVYDAATCTALPAPDSGGGGSGGADAGGAGTSGEAGQNGSP